MSAIRNRDQAKVPVDFKISNGKIGGTDIDFILEFDDKFLILVECKKEGSDIPIGQQLVLERIADAWRDSGRQAAVLHVTWKELDDGFINLRETKVRTAYTINRKWTPCVGQNTIEFINEIGKHWKCRKCRF